jgi:hypothetical protein
LKLIGSLQQPSPAVVFTFNVHVDLPHHPISTY